MYLWLRCAFNWVTSLEALSKPPLPFEAKDEHFVKADARQVQVQGRNAPDHGRMPKTVRVIDDRGLASREERGRLSAGPLLRPRVSAVCQKSIFFGVTFSSCLDASMILNIGAIAQRRYAP